MGHVESEAKAYTMSDHEAAATILAGIVRAVVRTPAKVNVMSSHESGGALLVLQVDPSDLENVVGAGGRTARSLRTVLTALGKKSGQHFTLDIQSHTS